MFDSDFLHLSLSFFIIAFFYSLAGFGGGSSYIALLVLQGVSYKTIPIIALVCNIVVVTGGVFHFAKKGHLSWRFLLPFVVLSIPCAYWGGSLSIKKIMYQIILGVSLLAISFHMFFHKSPPLIRTSNNRHFVFSLFIGVLLGFFSGLVGIGGGIVLSPFLHTMGWGHAKRIAATASAFILINSCAGLMGQMKKTGGWDTFLSSIPLYASVFGGGQLGSWICNNKISLILVIKITSFLVFIASLRLLLNAWNG